MRMVFWIVMALIALAAVSIVVEAALPPMRHAGPSLREEAPPETVVCGYHVAALWVALDLDTMRPLYLLSEEPIELGILPAPCPKGSS